MDFYKHTGNQYRRLVDEWLKYGRLIVAYDFDNTVFDYHDKGLKFDEVIKQLKELGKMGCYMICFTSCDPSRYAEIKTYLKNQGIPCHGINIDSEFVPFKGRKIYYNVFYDDRAGLGQVYDVMSDVIVTIGQAMRSKTETEKAENGEECAYSGMPFLNGDWYYKNTYPAAYPEYRKENDIIPDVEDLVKLFPKRL